MSYHTLQRKLEQAAKGYLEATVDDITVRGSEDIGEVWELRAVYCICPTANGVPGLVGNAACFLRLEVRTVLALYAARTAAITAHHVLFGSVADVLMVDDLAAQLATYGTDLTVQGVASGEDQDHRLDNNETLVSSITREIHATPQ